MQDGCRTRPRSAATSPSMPPLAGRCRRDRRGARPTRSPPLATAMRASARPRRPRGSQAGRWRYEPFEERSSRREWIDPRTLSSRARTAPARRQGRGGRLRCIRSAIPSMYLSVIDPRAWILPQRVSGRRAGARQRDRRRRRPPRAGSRWPRSAMAAPSWRCPSSRLPCGCDCGLLVVIYDDNAYGAEVHHFGPMGHDVDAVRFPDCDLAAIARAAGARGEGRPRRPTTFKSSVTWLAAPRPGAARARRQDQPERSVPNGLRTHSASG